MQWVLAAWVTGLCGGILAGERLRPLGEPALGAWLWWLLALLCALAWVALGALRRRWARPWPWVMALGACLGAGLHTSAPDPRDDAPRAWRAPDARAEVFGVVLEGSRVRPQERHSAQVEALRCDKAPCRARLWVALPEGSPPLASGDLVWLRGEPRLAQPREAPYLFDAQRWERAQGLAGALWVKAPEDVQRRGAGQGWAARLDRWRQGREAWAREVLGDAQAGPLLALVTGSRGLWTASQRAPIDATGLSHVMAISGLHLLVFWAGLRWAAKGALRAAPKALGAPWARALLLEALPLLLMLLYGELVAWPTSAQRAAAMVVGMRSARWCGRRSALGPALALSVGLILAVEGTHALFDPGLQLSVTAVAGLALGQGAGPPPKGAVGWVLGMAQASLASSAACAPWVAWHFGRVPALGLLLNLLAIPLSELGMLAAMLGGLAGPGALGELGLRAGGHAVGLIEALARACPYAGLSVGVAQPWGLALGVGAAALLAWRRAHRWALAALLASTLASGLLAPDPSAELVFLPVGQGDAILALDGQGRSFLMDTGGSMAGGLDPGARVIRPALLRRGVRRLDVLALSHGDADHTAGAASVIREFRPREIWSGPDLGPFEAELRAAAREVGAPIVPAPRAAQLGGLAFRRLDDTRAREGLSRNEQSAILEVRLGGARFVLTGDAEQAGEEGALDKLRPVHVLKVAHHGSRTSSSEAFLARARPQVAVVQSGRGNPFGHPHAEVVARLWSRGAVVLGTQECGELSVKVEGSTLEVWGQPRCRGVWTGPGRPRPKGQRRAGASPRAERQGGREVR